MSTKTMQEIQTEMQAMQQEFQQFSHFAMAAFQGALSSGSSADDAINLAFESAEKFSKKFNAKHEEVKNKIKTLTDELNSVAAAENKKQKEEAGADNKEE